jgi:hypothetical protein
VRSSAFTVRSSAFTVRSTAFTVRSSAFTVRSSAFTVRSAVPQVQYRHAAFPLIQGGLHSGLRDAHATARRRPCPGRLRQDLPAERRPQAAFPKHPLLPNMR